MKQLLMSYAIICVVVIAVLSLLSYGSGAGYVYVFFHGWQLQTNIWVLCGLLGLVSFLGQMLWLLCKKYLTRKKRIQTEVFSFSALHPYEKLAILWLLEADQEKKGMVQGIFDQSGLLKDVVHASFLWKQQQFDLALNLLNDAPSNAFELAELQRIELYLANQKGHEALTHLEFLNQHELSPWLMDIQQGYQHKLTTLWGRFAIVFPWLYLTSTRFGHLNETDKTQWLTQILATFEQATFEDLENLKERYLLMRDDYIFLSIYENKLLWLKILARLPEMAVEHEQLVELLLQERFNSEVFYMWFEQQLLCSCPDYIKIEETIEQWENKYSEVPIFAFAKWHIYQATQQKEKANQLLMLYPNHILMSYLRVKDKIQNDEGLIQELNIIFENDANFLKLNLS